MNIIEIKASRSALTAVATNAGCAGDHLATELSIVLEESVQGERYSYRLLFQTANGGRYMSETIWPDGDTFTFALPSILTVAGWLDVQLIVYEGDAIIAHTPKCTPALEILPSIKANTDIPKDYTGLIYPGVGIESVEIVDQHLIVTYENGKTHDAGVLVSAGTRYVDYFAANALKGSASGSVVSLSDVSPLEHEMAVTVRSKNLIPYPYRETTKTVNGITFTDNGDGSIEVVGTPTAHATFILQNELTLIDGQEYIIKSPSNGVHMYIQYDDADGNPRYVTDRLVWSKDYTFGQCYLQVFPSSNAKNTTVYPQLECGTEATTYTPYVADLSNVTVSKLGKNLIPYPYHNTTFKQNGITFTDNGDGTITLNGTATADAFFFCTNSFIPPAVGENYMLSGCPAGDGSKYRLDSYGGGISYIQDTGSGVVVTPTNNTKMTFRITVFKGATVTNLVFKPQLELGFGATEYEPYKAPQIYTANDDGTVDDGTASGVPSIYPTTTLCADRDGVVIDAEYNRDINKAFAELVQAIISLGGNV